jgi:hypothetical protein
VDHYAALLDSNALPSEAFCLTAVRGLSVDEALTRFDGFPSSRESTLSNAGQTAVNAFPDDLPTIVADHCDGWTLLAENNGFHGTMPEVLSRLSQGTVAASVFWNVNFASRASLAQNGRVLAVYDFVIGRQRDGDDPAKIAPFLHGLDFDDPYRVWAEGLAFLERVSGVRVTADWVAKPHPMSVIADPARFELSTVDSWLSDIGVTTAMPHISRTALRRAAALAATRTCQAVGIDDPAVLGFLADDADALPRPERAQRREHLAAQAREAYRQALELRWDRCQPLGETVDMISREDALHARAHALGAACARLAEAPAHALAGALSNAAQADRERWPALLDELIGSFRVALPDRGEQPHHDDDQEHDTDPG